MQFAGDDLQRLAVKDERTLLDPEVVGRSLLGGHRSRRNNRGQRRSGEIATHSEAGTPD